MIGVIILLKGSNVLEFNRYYVMFVTFSIWAFLFESREQEDQVPHIHKKGM